MNNTIRQQHKSACEEALRLFDSIEVAIEGQRIEFAKEEAKKLKAFLQNRGIHDFEGASAYLPEVTPNLREWSDGAAYSKSKIEAYLAELERQDQG